MPDLWILIASGIGGGFAMIILFKCAVCCCGFRRSGVAADSWASHRHHYIGDVEKGSCFAMCQSIGAAGLSCFPNAVLFVTGAAIAIGIVYFHEWLCGVSEMCGGIAGNSTETTTAIFSTTPTTITTLNPKFM